MTNATKKVQQDDDDGQETRDVALTARHAGTAELAALKPDWQRLRKFHWTL